MMSQRAVHLQISDMRGVRGRRVEAGVLIVGGSTIE